jgi:hypothetical protein
LLDEVVMRLIVGFSLSAMLLLVAPSAGADSMSLYLQGHGGEDSSVGDTVGGELGVNLLAFNLYVGFDDYLSRGSVLRAIAGFGSDTSFGGWRLSGRLGAGVMFENGDVFSDTAPGNDRNGLVGRAGLALDRQLSGGLLFGLAIDAEYFALKATDNSLVDTSVHTGADILGSLHLRFELGI